MKTKCEFKTVSEIDSIPGSKKGFDLFSLFWPLLDFHLQIWKNPMTTFAPKKKKRRRAPGH